MIFCFIYKISFQIMSNY